MSAVTIMEKTQQIDFSTDGGPAASGDDGRGPDARDHRRQELLVHSDPTKALEEIAKDTRTLEDGLETELTDDVEKAKGEEVRPDPDAAK